jgi:hypothetical protein
MLGTAQGITFDVSLDANQEVPPPTLNGANPSGSATLDVNTITGDVTVSGSYSGMTSNVSASHLHGLAGPGQATGVIFGFNVSGGTAGTFTGANLLSAENLGGLLAGQTYLNVHTATNGPGEIRGQVVDSDIKVFNVILTTDQEVPTPTLNGATPSGEATVVVDLGTGEVEVSGSYTGMTSNVSAAHIHGLASPGTATGVIFGFDVSGGTSGTFSGADVLSAENLAGLLAGQTYVNVHTATNGPGEIRAQVVPEPTSWLLGMLAFLSLVAAMRFRPHDNFVQ